MVGLVAWIDTTKFADVFTAVSRSSFVEESISFIANLAVYINFRKFASWNFENVTKIARENWVNSFYRGVRSLVEMNQGT